MHWEKSHQSSAMKATAHTLGFLLGALPQLPRRICNTMEETLLEDGKDDASFFFY